MEIVKAEFLGSNEASVDNLFCGFTTMRAITFSTGLDFMLRTISPYDDVEVIFGSPAVLDESILTIMSFQKELVQELALPKNAKRLAARVGEGTLRLYASRDMRSHEKLFLLEDEHRRRVITGSANFSGGAFFGVQREIITVFDNDKCAWEYYSQRYEDYRDQCSDHIDPSVIEAAMAKKEHLDDNPVEIPVMADKNIETVVVQETEPEEFEREQVFVAAIHGHERDLREYAPSPKKEDGAIVLKPMAIATMKKRAAEFKQRLKLQRQVMPVLDLDYERGTLTFNGVPQNLGPAKEQIANDIASLTGYIESLDGLFHGDVGQTQANYWKFASWYFGSIFAARMRYEAMVDGYEITNIPVIGIMYGDSNGGKSTFTRLLARLMSGGKVELSSSKDFTQKHMEKLRVNCKGLPIHIDDLAKDQWNRHNEGIVKDDRFGMNPNQLLLNYPAICISTNNIPSLKPEITKRVVACNVSARIDRDVGSKKTKSVNAMFNASSNALFREFVRRMLPRIDNMIDKMRQEDNDYFPDLLLLSSQTLCEIIDEHLPTRPAWLTEVGFEDYFGDKAVSQSAVRRVRRAWLSDPKNFVCSERDNKLVWSMPEGAPVWELRRVADELPASLNAKVTGRSLVMNLSDARELFGQTFKRSLWARILK